MFSRIFQALGGPFQTVLAAYASHDPGCLASVFQTSTGDDGNGGGTSYGFAIYSPILMMLQTLLIIGIGRIVTAFPRLNQRLERFHKSVVDEALMGKDPDVAEDFAGDSLSIEKILRQRQREEICGSLKVPVR